MITLDYIKAETKITVKNEDGSVSSGSYKRLKEEMNLPEFDVVEKMPPEGQSIELQPFWLTYRKATEEQGRKDLVLVDAFYEEWSKNPAQFEPAKKTVIGDLKSILDKYNDRSQTTNVIVKNYDGRTMRTEGHEDFQKALEEMGNAVIDVVEVNESYDEILKKLIVRIIIQCDDLNVVKDLAVLSNRYAADRIFGNK